MKQKPIWNKDSMKVKDEPKKDFFAEFDKAPHLVKCIWMMSAMNSPIGSNTYEEALDKHPEYFPEEVARRNKWLSIPQEVKDAYFNECSKMRQELHKDLPPSGGMIAWIENGEDYRKWEEAWSKIRPIEDQKEKELHDKYFGPYGL